MAHPPPEAQATAENMNRFVAVVDEFMQKFAKLSLPSTRTEIYASNNPALISDYESTLSKGRALKMSIDTTVGAWQTAKAGWASVTDVTSLYIGDAIDWLKALFGPESNGNLNALGIIQIPAAAFVIAAIGASTALIFSMDRIFIAMEASKIQRENPGTSRSAAYAQAKSGTGLDLFGGINQLAMIAGLAFVAYLYFGQKR